MNNSDNGQVKYFYHSPLSSLPIRDVTDGLSKGPKTEPHIEIGAENYLNRCYQPQIQDFVQSERQYLLLITTCYNTSLTQFFKEQFFVGYIQKEQVRQHTSGRFFVFGTTKIVPFTLDLLVTRFFKRKFDRILLKNKKYYIVNKKTTNKILDVMNKYPNKLIECVKEIIRLDKAGKTCHQESCSFRSKCLRIRYQRGNALTTV